MNSCWNVREWTHWTFIQWPVNVLVVRISRIVGRNKASMAARFCPWLMLGFSLYEYSQFLLKSPSATSFCCLPGDHVSFLTESQEETRIHRGQWCVASARTCLMYVHMHTRSQNTREPMRKSINYCAKTFSWSFLKRNHTTLPGLVSLGAAFF